MLARFGKKLRFLRRKFSRSEWAARHIYGEGDEARKQSDHLPGVLLIQIDGLSYQQMLKAIDSKRLPFLQRLIQREHFILRRWYSGLPSATPAVQAELFYGVKSLIPAFQYYDRDAKSLRTMFDVQAVDNVAEEVEKHHKGLLKGGSSYSNIYSGGAEEAPFCIQSMKLQYIFKEQKLRKIIWFICIHLDKLIKIIGLSLLETWLAFYDFCKGLYSGNNPFKEFKFIFSRIGVCIFLRELIHLHVKIDIARGLPIIHANFVGYDEHAHRRGPDSAFALWTLKGIDATIKGIVQYAIRSEKRDYRIFIYSDHGQEHSIPYPEIYGKSLKKAVNAVLCDPPASFQPAETDNGVPYLNLQIRSRELLQQIGAKQPLLDKKSEETGNGIRITAMGPLGHIYLPERPNSEQMRRYAKRLVSEAGIPLVFYVEGEQVIGVNNHVTGPLPRHAVELFGDHHPFLEEIILDMERICRHKHAGDFIISGWRSNGLPLTFPVENGSHGGPGITETHGFLILPDCYSGDELSFYRPLDLRKKVKEIVRESSSTHTRPHRFGSQNSAPNLKVMSYNIHSCIGIDGKLLPSRTARVINRVSPDIVALQEVDRKTIRARGMDQAQLLGDWFDMHSEFFPLLPMESGEYGLAVLCRYPVRKSVTVLLPKVPAHGQQEQRGVMKITCDTELGPLHVFNTHLSLFRNERIAQIKSLLEHKIVVSISDEEPIIFCGDLNSTGFSPAYRLLADHFADAQKLHRYMAPDATFASSFPLFRLDHIFHSYHLTPVKTEVPNDWECRLASDHLPVAAVFAYGG